MPQPTDEFEHFVDAQSGIYERVRSELSRGRKRSHWMWFIFPQLKGLGYSSTSLKYGIESLAQAQRYLAHAVLGPRLTECTGLVLQVQNRTASEIFGYPDDLKFRSSLTLFSLCCPPNSVFSQTLDKYFSGESDQKTLQLLGLSIAEWNRGVHPGQDQP
jgi:uncharacterized protein (DUF1810 family)